MAPNKKLGIIIIYDFPLWIFSPSLFSPGIIFSLGIFPPRGKISLLFLSLFLSLSLSVSLRQTRLIKPDDIELARQLDDLEEDRLSRLIERVR
jgi:hypothetical protein